MTEEANNHSTGQKRRASRTYEILVPLALVLILLLMIALLVVIGVVFLQSG